MANWIKKRSDFLDINIMLKTYVLSSNAYGNAMNTNLKMNYIFQNVDINFTKLVSSLGFGQGKVIECGR